MSSSRPWSIHMIGIFSQLVSQVGHRSEPPPHDPGTVTLVFPATRRPDVLFSMCCLWLEDKYLPGEHHHGPSRRMLSTLALGNLVLSHNFPPRSRVYCLLQHTVLLRAEVQWDSQVIDCDLQKREEELFLPIPFCSYCGSAKAFTSKALNIFFFESVFVFCMKRLPLV